MRYRFAMIDNGLRPNPYSPLLKIVRAADTATPHFSLLSPHYIINPSAQRTPQFLISNFSFLIFINSSLLSPHYISNLSAERTPHLLTPISSLYYKSVRGADTTISHFSFLISHSASRSEAIFSHFCYDTIDR